MQRRTLLASLAALPVSSIFASRRSKNRSSFEQLAEEALAAMHEKATALQVGGVAVVASFQGETVSGWRSRMMVVGRYKDEPTEKDKGSNLIGIAYAKAAEMADTHQNSGSHLRPPMTGEFGWAGGAIAKIADGYAIAAFSGGKDIDDLAVSHAGLAVLTAVDG